MSEGVLSMNVNFEYYRIFYYVAKYHNFTKAAHTLGSSQPNVTRAMNCLEQQINTTLFVRTNGAFSLPRKGKNFIPIFPLQCHRFLPQKRSYRIVRGCHMEALRSVSARPH